MILCQAKDFQKNLKNLHFSIANPLPARNNSLSPTLAIADRPTSIQVAGGDFYLVSEF
jgi:hypothetical protein